jgi:acyl transferase domain-containing protein
VVLKRAADAIRDGDPILALVRGSAINQDGATNGITAPSTPSQVAVIRTALASARLDPSQVNFVETHGTGTPLGDPIEVEAIATVYGATRAPGDPVVLGALKTNIGHLEGAAGIAGVIKTVLSLQHRRIPKNLHFENLNPLLQLDDGAIVLPTEARGWSAPRGSRIGAVSSFGFGGTNAHVILEEAPAAGVTNPVSDARMSGGVEALPLVLSAHSAEALRALVERWRTALRSTLRDVGIRDLAYTAAVRRTSFAHRVAVTGTDVHGWADRLDAWARARDHETLPALRDGERRKVAFAFCGQGPQWYAMGRDLAASEPVFRTVLERVAAAVQRVAGWDLLAELAKDDATSRIHETEITQPAMFAIQMGLVAMWRAWGVEPDFVIGHSMGEIAAACTAGAIDLEEGARIAVFRGQAVSQAEGLGQMVALPISAAAAAEAIAGLEDRVGIAAVNAPESVVVAGDVASLALVTDRLKAQGIEGKFLEVRYASHSPQMEPLVGWLRTALGSVAHRAPVVPMFSSIRHGLVEHAMLDAAHWGVGLRQSVDFSGGVRAALDDGCRVFVDIAPHPVMAGYMRECADAAGVEIAAVASLRRTVAGREQLLQSLGELFEAGVTPDWSAVLGARGRAVPLPAYAWQHARYWLAAPATRRPAAAAAHSPVETLHSLHWIASSSPKQSDALPRRECVLLGGDAALRQQLEARLRRDAIDCHLLSDDAGLDAVVETAAAARADIIDLRAMQEMPSASLRAAATSTAAALQELAASLSRRTHADGAQVRLWSVTRGAQAVQVHETPDARQAAVWGIGRVAAVELTESWGGLIDLDPSADTAQDVDDIVHALTQHTSEYESAYRAGARHVPRLRALAAVAGTPSLAGDGHYVVSGGLGAVGLVVAEWLARCGARRIVLLGRTPLPPRALWDASSLSDEERRRIDGVRAIESHGATVHVGSLDVSDVDALTALADERQAAGWGTVRGILHCAVAVQFSLLRDLDDDAIGTIMTAKIGGAEALLQAFGAQSPDFFVVFSSIAVLLGERGQAAYAAANATMDAWTLRQRRAGHRVSSIDWVVWLETTSIEVTRGVEMYADGLRLRGVLPVTRAMATAALAAVITGDVPVCAVFGRGVPESAGPALDAWRVLEQVHQGHEAATAPMRSVRDELLELRAPRERFERLTGKVHEVVAEMLGLDLDRIELDRPLGPLGMDSLLAIRIRRRCERVFDLALPATALFSYPTVAALSGLVFEKLGLTDAATLPSVTPASAAEASTAAVATLSDDEALAALRTRRPAKRSSP